MSALDSTQQHFGDDAVNLVKAIRRSMRAEALVAFEDDFVRAVVRETRHIKELLMQARQKQLQAEADRDILDDSDTANLEKMNIEFNAYNQLMFHVFNRNKRALMIATRSRLDLLRRIPWQTVHIQRQAMQRHANHPADKQFVTQYQALVERHRQRLLRRIHESNDIEDTFVALDWRESLMDMPPHQLHVTVRVLKDVGDVLVARGAVLSLRAGTMHHVRLSDVAELFSQGFLGLEKSV